MKAQALEEKDLMPNERVTVILSKAGWVRCAKGDGIDLVLTINRKINPIWQLVVIPDIKLVFFTKLGKAYSMYVDKFPSARGYGEHITTYIPLDKKDEIINMVFVNASPHFY